MTFLCKEPRRPGALSEGTAHTQVASLTTQLLAAFMLCAALTLIGVPAFGHHGDAGRYEETITRVSGTVVALQVINPHSRIIFDVEDEGGEVVRWQAEIQSANRLAQMGWNQATLKPGDQITLFGRLVRSGAPYINLSERALLIRTDTCEELYRSTTPPDYPAPTCEP